MPCELLGRGCQEEHEGLFHPLAKLWSYTLSEFTAVWEEGALALQWYSATQNDEEFWFLAQVMSTFNTLLACFPQIVQPQLLHF